MFSKKVYGVREEVSTAAITLKRKISKAVMSCFLWTLQSPLINCIIFMSSLQGKKKKRENLPSSAATAAFQRQYVEKCLTKNSGVFQEAPGCPLSLLHTGAEGHGFSKTPEQDSSPVPQIWLKIICWYLDVHVDIYKIVYKFCLILLKYILFKVACFHRWLSMQFQPQELQQNPLKRVGGSNLLYTFTKEH